MKKCKVGDIKAIGLSLWDLDKGGRISSPPSAKGAPLSGPSRYAKCRAKAAVSFCVLRPQIEQLHRTERMSCLGSYRGTNHTQEAQSPGWPGACLPGRAGRGRPAQATSRARVISAICGTAGYRGEERSRKSPNRSGQCELPDGQQGASGVVVKSTGTGQVASHLSGSHFLIYKVPAGRLPVTINWDHS